MSEINVREREAMAPAASSPARTPRRRPALLQFSLRGLFALTTLAAVGTAVWFRWPIEEEIDLYYGRIPAGTRARVPPHMMKATREVRTVRRVWGWGRIRHGPTRKYNFAGQLVSEVYWREGVQHGPERTWRADGTLEAEKEFFNGERDGIWKFHGFPGTPAMGAYQQSWRRDWPHGIWLIRDSGSDAPRTFEFRDGVAIRAGGQPIVDPLMSKWLAGRIDDRRIHATVTQDALFDFVDMPLKDVPVYLQECYGVPMRLNERSKWRKAEIGRDLITTNIGPLPLSVALTATLHPLDMVADYRYGCIVIVPAAEAFQEDITGVSQLKPPPDSLLAAQWDRPLTLNFQDAPLDDIAAKLTQETGIAFDTGELGQIDPRVLLATNGAVNLTWKRTSLKNCLGTLCSVYGLRLQQRGEVLVFERQEP